MLELKFTQTNAYEFLKVKAKLISYHNIFIFSRSRFDSIQVKYLICQNENKFNMYFRFNLVLCQFQNLKNL